MSAGYYVMYNPLTFNLMDALRERELRPACLISYLTGRDGFELGSHNYADYLVFDLNKHRVGLVEAFAIESYAAQYVANQVARGAPQSRVIHADDMRRTVREVIHREGCRPRAVFITAMSSNFPTAVAASIVLNHGRIPVVLGGIHVLTSPGDVDTYIRDHCPHPQLVTLVRGAGDSQVISRILDDVSTGNLKREYSGEEMIEDGVWQACDNVDRTPPLHVKWFRTVPLVGSLLERVTRIHPVAPFLGCPYSCRFCSVSCLPKQSRKLACRNTDDFLAELEHVQGSDGDLSSRLFFFLPDNLLLGAAQLDEILDKMIGRRLKINFIVQVSIEIASNERLLKKLRLAGATHFFIGFESLDIRNLRYVAKHCVKTIERSGLSVPDYYARRIRTIQGHGISIHGAFIFGLPHDYFRSLQDHTGKQVADFCIRNRIGLQPTLLTDLPGSQLFQESQRDGTGLYGRHNSPAYLGALCVTDMTEPNRVPPPSLGSSALRAECMAYEATRRAGAPRQAFRNAVFAAWKSFRHPTARGRATVKERLIDSVVSSIAQFVTGYYRNIYEGIAFSSPHVRGAMERLYELEKDPATRQYFRDYVTKFSQGV